MPVALFSVGYDTREIQSVSSEMQFMTPGRDLDVSEYSHRINVEPPVDAVRCYEN